MNIGIHLSYVNRDQTIVALSYAAQLIKAGFDIEIMSTGTRVKSIDPRWDNKIVNGKDSDFFEWVVTKDIIIWPEPPPIYFIAHANENGVKTVLIGFWETLLNHNIDCYHIANVVMSPLLQSTFILRDKWQLPRVHYWPINLDIPYTQKPNITSDSLKILIPICDSQASYVMMDIFKVIENVVQNRKGDLFTVLSSSKFLKQSRRCLNYIKDRFSNVVIREDVIRSEQIKLFSKHDLTVRCSIRDGCGLNYLTSIIQGTPVVTFDVPPVRELIGNMHNVVYCSCETEQDLLGVPIATPDYNSFSNDIIYSIDRKVINKLHKDLSQELKEHNKLSNDGLTLATELKF